MRVVAHQSVGDVRQLAALEGVLEPRLPLVIENSLGISLLAQGGAGPEASVQVVSYR